MSDAIKIGQIITSETDDGWVKIGLAKANDGDVAELCSIRQALLDQQRFDALLDLIKDGFGRIAHELWGDGCEAVFREKGVDNGD